MNDDFMEVAVDPGERPARLLWYAVLWLLLAVGLSFLMAAVVAFVVKFRAVTTHANDAGSGTLPTSVIFALSLTVVYLTMLWAAWRRGRIVGQGDRTAGLSLGRMRRVWPLGLAALILLPVLAGWVMFLKNVLHLRMPEAAGLMLQQQMQHLGLAEIVILANIAVLAPVAEELWFRGWLWNGLRRHWGLWPVALVTSAFWIVLHAGEGTTKLLILLPLAVMQCVLRHVCGSTRATTVLHMLNNSLAVAVLLAASV